MLKKILLWVKEHYDEFHMYITIVLLNLISGCAIWTHIPESTFVQVTILFAYLIVWILHSTNENIQALDKNVIKKYGSWGKFQKNSKRDWKFFLLGCFLGGFLIVVQLSIRLVLM